MKTAYVLLTALPPTKGHLQLVQFASELAERGVTVIVGTQDREPFPSERVEALKEAIKHHGLRHVKVVHLHRDLEQDPSTPGFKEMWWGLMRELGAGEGDYIVASETYGQWLAEGVGAQFFPYDIDRDLRYTKATRIRERVEEHFGDILEEFQEHLRFRVTVFGAESTGKTTLSRELARELGGQWLFEYARPYLEHTRNEITTQSMTGIWKGQAALQRHAHNLPDTPYIVQDTDLYSTVGYWEFPHWQPVIGAPPRGLLRDAAEGKSDLYLLLQSNIPFEADPLRYGGDKREGSDEYWEDICKRYELPYVVIETSDPVARKQQALRHIRRVAKKRFDKLAYDRHGF